MTHLLPTALTLRPPQRQELPRIQAVLRAWDVATCGYALSTSEEVEWGWKKETFTPATDSWVVLEPEGDIVGYAQVVDGKQAPLSFLARVHPASHDQRIASFLLSLIERRAGELVHLAQPARHRVLKTWITDTFPWAMTFFNVAGYTCVRSLQHLTMVLREAPPPPLWPEGIAVHPFVPERDATRMLEVANEAFQDHWGYLPGALEEWYRCSFTNRGILGFLAVDEEEVAGICLCETRLATGFVEVLAVRQPWRRRGLGMALLCHAYGEYYRRGVSTIDLLVDMQNPTGAVQLYRQAGMQAAFQLAFFEKAAPSFPPLDSL